MDTQEIRTLFCAQELAQIIDNRQNRQQQNKGCQKIGRRKA
ncbi:MAG: hypothetical protein RIR97_1903, partial [Pseudomonadota bacterium]